MEKTPDFTDHIDEICGRYIHLDKFKAEVRNLINQIQPVSHKKIFISKLLEAYKIDQRTLTENIKQELASARSQYEEGCKKSNEDKVEELLNDMSQTGVPVAYSLDLHLLHGSVEECKRCILSKLQSLQLGEGRITGNFMESLRKQKKWMFMKQELEYILEMKVVIEVFYSCCLAIQKEFQMLDIDMHKCFGNIEEVYNCTVDLWNVHFAPQCNKECTEPDFSSLVEALRKADEVLHPYEMYYTLFKDKEGTKKKVFGSSTKKDDKSSASGSKAITSFEKVKRWAQRKITDKSGKIDIDDVLRSPLEHPLKYKELMSSVECRSLERFEKRLKMTSTGSRLKNLLETFEDQGLPLHKMSVTSLDGEEYFNGPMSHWSQWLDMPTNEAAQQAQNLLWDMFLMQYQFMQKLKALVMLSDIIEIFTEESVLENVDTKQLLGDIHNIFQYHKSFWNSLLESVFMKAKRDKSCLSHSDLQEALQEHLQNVPIAVILHAASETKFCSYFKDSTGIVKKIKYLSDICEWVEKQSWCKPQKVNKLLQTTSDYYNDLVRLHQRSCGFDIKQIRRCVVKVCEDIKKVQEIREQLGDLDKPTVGKRIVGFFTGNDTLPSTWMKLYDSKKEPSEVCKDFSGDHRIDEQNAIWDFLLSEESYLKHLQVLIKVKTFCKTSTQISVDKQFSHVLFSNIDEIINDEQTVWQHHVKPMVKGLEDKKLVDANSVLRVFQKIHQSSSLLQKFCSSYEVKMAFIQTLEQDLVFATLKEWVETKTGGEKFEHLLNAPIHQHKEREFMIRKVLENIREENVRTEMSKMLQNMRHVIPDLISKELDQVQEFGHKKKELERKLQTVVKFWHEEMSSFVDDNEVLAKATLQCYEEWWIRHITAIKLLKLIKEQLRKATIYANSLKIAGSGLGIASTVLAIISIAVPITSPICIPLAIGGGVASFLCLPAGVKPSKIYTCMKKDKLLETLQKERRCTKQMITFLLNPVLGNLQDGQAISTPKQREATLRDKRQVSKQVGEGVSVVGKVTSGLKGARTVGIGATNFGLFVKAQKAADNAVDIIEAGKLTLKAGTNQVTDVFSGGPAVTAASRGVAVSGFVLGGIGIGIDTITIAFTIVDMVKNGSRHELADYIDHQIELLEVEEKCFSDIAIPLKYHLCRNYLSNLYGTL